MFRHSWGYSSVLCSYLWKWYTEKARQALHCRSRFEVSGGCPKLGTGLIVMKEGSHTYTERQQSLLICLRYDMAGLLTATTCIIKFIEPLNTEKEGIMMTSRWPCWKGMAHRGNLSRWKVAIYNCQMPSWDFFVLWHPSYNIYSSTYCKQRVGDNYQIHTINPCGSTLQAIVAPHWVLSSFPYGLSILKYLFVAPIDR